ncbi:enoyl-ACP reductase [Verrucomicrobiaceae bacterium N1E253]|uniref:Enoyl-[acyl-carrier-protein] reductase [NADH] n=1 Tax=Oceaniferula marina TaxID=2748318 RepID=A0A851GI16_9BACT|nr:enoyl-ACP reductase [Oceaniferula marina]NWK56839.1 enoyl-ACP reductase [Oceaniferula marina]
MSDQPLAGKTAVVFGVANKRSIAWAIAKAWADAGAKLIFNYAGDRLQKNVEQLATTFGEDTPVYPCDVTSDEEIDSFFENVKKHTDKIDLVLHSVAFAPKEALQESFVKTSREAYAIAHDVSAYSLVAISQRAEKMMPDGGSIIAMSFYGAVKVVPNYNVMGVAKASLEASTRYLAADLGRKNIRVNCISAGPVQTLAGRGVSDFGKLFKYYEDHAPMGRTCTPEELGCTGVFLASDGSASITGQVLYVDGGYEIVAM